ncbi:translocation/assembly module TamB domain-containing protein [Pedobacter cryotolerans]|uniref:translocation/assembly module TamB domain-containing protein n=1 Tax=Pedobacter cryotolerans TaxID=2571270 RepID=UPI001CEC63BC|nr:translocation/assembly module TamB domain-containing protein [Pedobacter cryotolerans]
MLAALLFSLKFKPVQTFAAKKAAAYLSKELNTTIKIDGLYVKPFKSVVLEGLLVLDLQKDTLAHFPKFLVDLNKLSLKERILDVNTVQVNNGAFFLKDYQDGSSNLDFIIDYFDSPAPVTKKKKKKFQFLFDRIILNNVNFKYKNLKVDTTIQGINFDDIDVTKLNGIFEKLNTKDHVLQSNIKNLSLREKSGFYLKNLSSLTTIDTNAIELKNLMLVTNKTRLSDYFQMKFTKMKDFNDFVNKVRMNADFKNSHISSSDIAFFTPALKKMKLEIDIDGEITGLVNNLKARNLSLKTGKATYIKGDFSLKGLPNWEETFMDMKIEMAGTNKKDLDEILTDITGKKVKSIPAIVNKFGNVNFNGSFTGFQNDFIAYGEFKTQLGRIKSDVNMKIDGKGNPSYTGNVKTYDFNLGELLGEKSLGRITSALYVKGKGIDVKDLSEQLKGDITYIDFNGYRYRNVTVNGTFNKKYFDGNLKINDKNVQLVFDGGVNLNPTLPVFNFKATITKARLRALKLYKDSLQVDAIFSTNFSGNNLDNIQGSLSIEQIRLNNVKGIYNIDSVQLTAQGIGIDRSLSIKSDILDASIKGQYDLNSIVSYYKAIAKTYVPSLKTEIINYKPQIFDFDLRVKRFEPIAELILPGLEIEDEAILIGSFDSRNYTASLNGSIKKLTYKGIIANNIIIDESTTERQLTAIITSDRVDLNDSLFIKNVNISNVLRNDSLALNVKLSNADDANQLDLNGLVEFAGEQTAKISILPSNLKINSEDWNIQDKVRISFDNGKTEIDGFSLSNEKQILKIDGVISDDPKDLLAVGFENFSLKTLNPFVKTFGVKLAGTVNGRTHLYDILKSPRINDSLKIDSLTFNDTYIGSLTDTSSYNKSENIAKIYTQILADDKETLKMTGNLDLKEKMIDVSVKLDETKLTILEPFVKQLVSNLKGNISADIGIKGNFEKPQINGNISFNQGELTVNYLKTAYTLNDKVEVNNSVILIDNLGLRDADGNNATANGTVDLNNLNTPTIEVDLVANNFMALNTTAKDNSVYYGKAYASGNFSFSGPTDNMVINIDAKTEKGTIFNLPLNSSETVSDKDFITFVSRDSTQIVKRKTSFNGLTMNFKLRVDPNSTANIYTVLGKLSGKGNAELELNINSVGDFEMKGDYIIETGVFDFTAQEVINKRFDIRQGGTIRWTGNPTTAQINLKAIYALRASTGDLYVAANRDQSSNNNERIQTEVEMGLTGLLLQPDIKLDIFFPANPAKKEEFQSYFNDGNNLNTQALSLIIQRRFAPGTGQANLAQQLGSVGTSTATELIFNQFNNLLSSLNLNFVDINIRNFNDASASFKFFNDRVIVNAGIVDNSAGADLSFNGFRGNVGREVEILGLIKKDGTLVGKLANKPPTLQSIFANPGVDQNRNVTSLGLIYNQQFDTFNEFLQKITGKYRRDQKRKAEQKEKAELTKEAVLKDQKKTTTPKK